MATSKDTAEFILDKLGDRVTFSVRPMFGEYCLYANRKPVAFICDDTLFVKIVPASEALAAECELGQAYPGSKPYYIADESLLDKPELVEILLAIADATPAKKS